MKTSKNYSIGKNKFFNIAKGKKNNHFFFCLPSIVIAPKSFLNWDTVMFSIFIAWGNFFIQFNICEIVKNTNQEVYKETMTSLMSVLKSIGIDIVDGPESLNFLNRNPYLTQIVKNANLSHVYIKNILFHYFQNQPFVKMRN